MIKISNNLYYIQNSVMGNSSYMLIRKFSGGIRTMKDLTHVLIVTDPVEEKNAILEARKLNIPTLPICNPNAVADNSHNVMPADDYSLKSIYLIIGILADAIALGQGKIANYIGKSDSEIILPESKNQNQ